MVRTLRWSVAAAGAALLLVAAAPAQEPPRGGATVATHGAAVGIPTPPPQP
jgi:hypothetical protein